MTALPGVVDQDDLDARWINVVPALGVALALGLTVAAARSSGVAFAPHARGDRLRLVLARRSCCCSRCRGSPPRSGFYFPGDVFMGEEIPPVRDEGLAAVHLGFHHGTAGVLLALTALALSRAAGRTRALAAVPLAHARLRAREPVQDAWNEQLWKRGSVDDHIESVLRPELSARLARRSSSAPSRSRAVVPARACSDNRGMDGADGLPRLRQVRARGQDLRAAADHRRRPGRRPADARLGRGRRRPAVASRTERTILHDMGQEPAGSPLLDEALSLAERLADDAASGRVDLADLGRRARKLLESSSRPGEASRLF